MTKVARPIDVRLITDSDRQRLWAGFVVAPSGCWIWLRARSMGYGVMKWRGSSYKTHRLMWVIANGKDAPTGYEIDHLCRVHRCCNPAHLDAVPPQINVLRGRGLTAKFAERDTCVRGHVMVPDRARGGRRCAECRRPYMDRANANRIATVRTARELLGMKHLDYVAVYGQGIRNARAVIAAHS